MPWFRGIVMVHIEFTANSVLMIVIGLLARKLCLGKIALHVWFWTLAAGTWLNGAGGLVAAFTGQSSLLLPTANQNFPPPVGADNPVATRLLLTPAPRSNHARSR